jgi:hypothetical protein
MSKTSTYLRAEFELQTEKPWNTHVGLPSFDYVFWLEKKILAVPNFEVESSELHVEATEKLAVLEKQLTNKIADIGHDELMDLYLKWQRQRNDCNELFLTVLAETLSNGKM